MCHDGNSAPLSVRYLNSQLTTLWQNAVQCTDESKNGTLDVASQEYEKSKYTRALAQFHYFGARAPTSVSSTGDFFFYARFGQPDLKFICNHEAIVSFSIERANLNLDFGKSSVTGCRADHQMNKDLHDVQVTFRMPFTRHDVKSADSVLNPRPFNHLVRLTLLDMESAHFLSLKSSVSLDSDVERALKFYLAKYLMFLQQGGLNILYDVPHNDDVQIDYTLQAEMLGKMEVAGKTKWFTGLKVHSVDVQKINEYLLWVWQGAVRRGRPSDLLSVCIAEMSSNWVTKRAISEHFFVRFGPPEVKALCPHEAIVSFNVEDVAWFDSTVFTVPKNVYHNWVISFVMDTVEEREGSLIRIKAKFGTARFSSLHSKRPQTDSLSAHYFSLLVKFLQGNYFDILIRYSLHILYVSDYHTESSQAIVPTYKPGVAPSDEETTLWTKQIQSLNFYGYDEITALSEESLNLVLQSSWIEECRRSTDNLLAYWGIDCFKASFLAPTIRLLSDGKAIIWITAKNGEVEVTKESTRKDFWTWPPPAKPVLGEAVELYRFTEPSIFAFEVDLKMADDISLVVGDAWRQKFYQSEVWKRFQEQRDWHVFRHLYFDLRNATYVPELSNVIGIGRGRESLMRMATMVYSAKGYLGRLAHAGYNIIYSVPVWTNRLQNLGYAATDVKYQVVTKNTVTQATCSISRTVYESPVILLLAMTKFRTMPSTFVPWHDLWVIWNRMFKTVGSVYLSEGSFSETRLLTLLEEVNRKTTLLPKFAGVVKGEWTFDITTWEQDIYRKNQACTWERNALASNENYVEYDWEYYDEWSHRHKGYRANEQNAESMLSCQTTNKVLIPTAYGSDNYDIELKGESKLTVSGTTDNRKWTNESIATWSSTIRVSSSAGALSVALTREVKPTLSLVSQKQTGSVDVVSLHAKYLPQSIDVSDILSALKIELQGQWTLYGPGMQRCVAASSIITKNGGRIIQLRQATETETVVSQSTPVVVASGPSTISTTTVISPKAAPVVVETGKRYSGSVAEVLQSINETTSAEVPKVIPASADVVSTDVMQTIVYSGRTTAPAVTTTEKRYSNSIANVLKSISSDASSEVTGVQTTAPTVITQIASGSGKQYSSSVADVLKSISSESTTTSIEASSSSGKHYSSSVADVLKSISSEPASVTTTITETKPVAVETTSTSTVGGSAHVTSGRYSNSIADVLKSISESPAQTTTVTESVTNGTAVVHNGTPIVVSNGTPVVLVDKKYSNSVEEVLKSVAQMNTTSATATETMTNGGPIPNGTPYLVSNGAPVVAVADKRYASTVAAVMGSLSSPSTEYSGSQNGDSESARSRKPSVNIQEGVYSSLGFSYWCRRFLFLPGRFDQDALIPPSMYSSALC
ncbi:hypothetical protein NM688_g6177 [Phlebia brevispora]|uniref:Uncharacterized protein n=1 Tax=Phlebia brevispora TaxID=194682 RepID=A0ACC1SJ39_9APHY|nr:hypothetical protein NM688_g6177 [Phlebia brevispora]